MDSLMADTVSFAFDVADTEVLPESEVVSSEEEETGVISQLMDIREPLLKLRSVLEQKLDTDLSQYDFWLQDQQQLEETMTLVEQCVQGEGLVQINVELKVEPNGLKKINIVDVLKPAEDPSEEEQSEDDAEAAAGRERDTVTRWVVCSQFRKEQERLSIPTDPAMWDTAHVLHWLRWALNTFRSASIDPADWQISGASLCSITHDQFKQKVSIDPSDLFWTHLELLRKCKFVAVVQKSGARPGAAARGDKAVLQPLVKKKKPVTLGVARVGLANNIPDGSPGNRSGNNGQVQLWQFLLELLTDKEHREVIHWLGEEGEFKLNNPEVVAQLWGARKNKPNMNYEKLSRALRYYYDGDMICKVHGKRFVYKFVCDLKQLLGYSASELGRKVEEAERRSINRGSHLLSAFT